MSGGGGASAGGGSGSGSYTSKPMYADEIMQQLRGLFPNGAFNQGVVDRRVSNASDALNRNRKSQLETVNAALASRGQGINDGTYGTARGNLETRLGEDFNSNVNDIYAKESENADQRMMQALSLATGMTLDEAKNMIDMARISADERMNSANVGLGYHKADQDYALGSSRNANDLTLGLGGLANQNTRNQYDYSLGLGNLGVQRDQLTIDQMSKLLEMYLNGANTSAGGHF